MNDLLPGLRAALAREEAASAARSTAEVELAATGSTPSPSAEPTRAERFMDDASAVADAIDALRDDLDVVKALDTRRGAPHPPHASSHPPDARRRRPPSAVFPFRADLTLTRATTQGADRLDDPPRRRAGPRDGDRGDARVR